MKQKQSHPSIKIHWQQTRDITITVLGLVALFGILLWILGQIFDILLILLIAALISFLLYPLVQHVKRYIPGFLAVVIIYLSITLIIGSFLFIIVNRTILEGFALISFIKSYTLHGKDIILPFVGSVHKLLQNASVSQMFSTNFISKSSAQLSSISQSIIPFFTNIFNALFDTIIIIILSIYTTLDGPKFID